jgi:membrane protein YdbS with pleckstrin-like domain
MTRTSEKDKEIHRKVEKEKQEKVEKELMKTLTKGMRALGFVFLFAFSMIGAVMFYYMKGTGNIIQVVLVASVVVIMLFAMTQVKKVE